MRLDKFLKVSRIIKRRSVAKEVCDAKRISLNGRPAKAGSELKVGDRLQIGFGRRQLEIEVLELAETVRANEADRLYKVLKDEKTEPREDFFS